MREPVDFSEESLDMIEQTRLLVANLDEEERFLRAKTHLEDALQYRQPRIDRFDPAQHVLFRRAYAVQTHSYWETLVQVLSFIYMYLLLLEGTESDWVYRYGSIASLVVFWTDLFLELLHSSQDKARKESKFP